MNHRTLGQSDFLISEVGLGCWQFGGDFGPMETSTALKIMETAAANGITFFDTADVYGNGRSEELIGEFLKHAQTPIKIATKFGRSAEVYPNGYTKEALRSSVLSSLKRLGTDTIDLIQLHCIPIRILQNGAVFDWLREIQKEGLIKHFGASVESVEEALICMEQPGLVSLQVIFNLLRQKLIADLLFQARKKGIGIIVRLPLASGLLSGKFTANTRFLDSDHRNYNRNGQAFNVGETFAGLPFEKGVALCDRIKQFVPPNMTMAQMAQRWILDHDAVSTIIPGASSCDQVSANAAVSQLDSLPEELHQKLHDFYQMNVHEHIRGPY